MKKLIFLFITLITLTNVSYASFPVTMEPVISIDTIIPDSTKINNDKPVREARPEGSKESTEEYHLRMEKQGFDVSTCMCPDCRRFKGVNAYSAADVRKESEGRVVRGVFTSIGLTISILFGIFIIILFSLFLGWARSI